ncbi:Mu transposase domain-containing protein, partial [Neolewinella litorea]|uniref:Mu transposase domain-containing protein n=1 Tax=Neolewinella litorea TaxID=2562452 RepID=UPI003872D598
YERECLRRLPSQPFELRTTTRAKVQRNYHVELGPNHNFYSVPYQYVGQTATVVYSRRSVEVFIGTDRVATHPRLHPADRYRYRTEAGHLPRSHAEYLAAEGHDGAHFRSWGARIGPATAWAVDRILTNKSFEVQAYRSCQGVQSLARRYGPDRLEAAAERCRTAGQARYGMLRNILERGLDRTGDQCDLFTPPDHDNIRGPAAYR